ncbi:MAG: PA-phosphatase [Lunatimonas sp.]|uniref:PA-phosphatase n=1 Tax=Lunatimonas sp. TaxID=2060141 RepID=UPI002A3C1BEF|nr:PA-phosphatase [Lunatimonas sp.]
MNKELAWILSVVFQPLLMPSLIVAILMYLVPEATATPASARWSLLLLVGLTTCVVPLISMVGMRLTYSIDSFHLPDRQQRVIPFSLVTVFYGMTAAFFYFRLNVDQLITYTLVLVTLCLVILTVITFFWKISAHATALSGVLAILCVLMIRYDSGPLFYPFLASIVAMGAVGSARLALNVHRPAEILGGFLLGFGVCFGAYYYLLVP